jgi:hypothetical protein
MALIDNTRGPPHENGWTNESGRDCSSVVREAHARIGGDVQHRSRSLVENPSRAISSGWTISNKTISESAKPLTQGQWLVRSLV